MNAIHFLCTGASDCIILESNGKFAMIDAAEDTDYPKNKPLCKLKGYEEQVVEYLFKHCADENGEVCLDFILGTHSHSDHIGGFDTVILNPKVKINRAYLKPYHPEGINFFERTQWDNLEVYTQMKDALNSRNIPIISEPDETPFYFGDFKLTLFNGKYRKYSMKTGENENSIVTLAELEKSRILLAGDMNFKQLGEKEICGKIGKVDLLKVGHHCYEGSSSPLWLKTLNPDIAVITNSYKGADKIVLERIKKYASPEVFTTADSGGVKAVITENGIEMQTGIM